MLFNSIETPDSITVNKRDGASVTVDMTRIPAKFFADFITDGVAEYIRDSSSAALANAYDVANPDHELEGKALREARNAWVIDNVDAMAVESVALMSGALSRLYDGERRVARESNANPLDAYVIKVLRAVMKTDDGKEMKEEHDAIDSGDQKARRDYLFAIAAKNEWVMDDAAALKVTADAATAALAAKKITITL